MEQITSKQNAVALQEPAEELTVMSERVRILTDTEATGGRYEVFEITGVRTGGVPFHRHPWDEEFHVLEGSVEVFCHKKLLIRKAGESLRVTAGELHAWRAGEEGVKFLSITSPGGVSRLFRAIHDAGGTISLPELMRLNRINEVEVVLPKGILHKT